MAQTAAHLVERVIPWVPTRQWVVAMPMPLRDWMASSQALTAQVQTIIRTTIRQYYVTQAVTRGIDRQQAHPGSVTFIQRFGSAINLNMHFHMLFLEGVYLDRTDQGRKPRFLTGEPPTDADIADVVQQISRRVIRTLRQLFFLSAQRHRRDWVCTIAAIISWANAGLVLNVILEGMPHCLHRAA